MLSPFDLENGGGYPITITSNGGVNVDIGASGNNGTVYVTREQLQRMATDPSYNPCHCSSFPCDCTQMSANSGAISTTGNKATEATPSVITMPSATTQGTLIDVASFQQWANDNKILVIGGIALIGFLLLRK